MAAAEVMNDGPSEILVVDDAPDSIRMLFAALTGQGYRVKTADSGEMALAAVSKEPPDLILLDVMMPGVDGYEVCRRLKTQEHSRYIPVIFISGLGDAIDKVKAFEVGGVDYITKPLQMEEVLARVKTQLKLKKTQIALKRSHDALEARVIKRTQELEAANQRLQNEVVERRQAKQKLEQESNLRDILLDNLPCFAMIIKKGSQEIVASNRMAKDAGAVPGATCFQTWAGQEHQCPFCLASKLWDTGEPQRIEIEHHSAHYEAIWVPLTEELYVHYILDISDRKQVEIELRKSEARFRSTFEQAAVGIVHADLDGRFRRINDRFCEIVGYSKVELMGLSWSDITHPDDLPANLESFESFQARKMNTYSVQKRYIRKDQTAICTNVTISFVRGASGSLDYLIAVIEDITQRRKMEAQLLQAHKMEAVGTLAGGIAHDFNNILSSILGFAELGLEDVTPGSELEDSLQEICLAGIRARDLVKQILAFARQTKQETTVVSVGAVCREAVKLLRATIPASIEIQRYIGSNTFIMADAGMIHQIVMNLCTNAFHAMEENGGVLSLDLADVILDIEAAKIHPDLKPGAYLKLTIADTGIGISPVDMNAIFDPYFTTKAPGKGTGLGLSVVHGIVKDHGGAITVESQPGQGSRFSVYIPDRGKQVEPAVPVDDRFPGGRESILFVDDERAVVKSQTRLLKRLGYVVESYTSAIEALEVFKSRAGDFDLVITDMAMPQMSGDNLAVELIKIHPGIPVVLCTGYSSLISKERAIAIGIKGFVYKPIVKNDLAMAVRRVLDEQKGI